MKTQPIDFVLSTILLSLLSLGALLITGGIASPSYSGILGPYAVLLDALLFLLTFGLLCAVSNRCLLKLKPLVPGEHSMDDAIFTWWKLFTVTYEFGRGALLPFTTVFAKPLVASLFGARIGNDIALGGHLVDPEHISIGDEAIIGHNCVITAHTITSGLLILSPVSIGAGATVGVHAVVMSGVQIGAGAVVTAGAVVQPNTTIPAGELWGGIPAVKIKSLAEDPQNDS